MGDRFGYGAVVRAMRPEEREEMLALLLEAVAGEMPAAPGAEPPEACPRCGCPRTARKGRDADGGHSAWGAPYNDARCAQGAESPLVIVLEEPADVEQAWAFVTCSYQTSNSRTVVYAKGVEAWDSRPSD